MHRIYKKKRIWDFFSNLIYKRFKIIIGNSISVVNSLKSIIKNKKVYLINNGIKYKKKIIFSKKKKNYVVAIYRL
jgi:hypothetical protein